MFERQTSSSAPTSATRSLQDRLRWALTGLGLALLVLLVLPSAQIKLGASQLKGLVGSYTGPGPHYDVSYSGGTTTVNSNPPTPYSSSTSTSAPGAWGGGAYTYFTTSGGSITCAGQITANFTWNGGPNSAPAPPAGSVVVTETANAYWSGPGSKGDCGLSNPTTPGSSPPSQTATRYSVQGGPSFSVTATPTASASGFALSGNSPLSANAFVGYTATLSVATMNLDGAILDSNGNYNILVGQGCGVSVPALSASNTTYSWTVSGTTFQDWQHATPANPKATPPTPANSDASYYVDGSGPLNQGTAHWPLVLERCRQDNGDSVVYSHRDPD